MRNIKLLILLAIFSAALASCGGGNNDDDTSQPIILNDSSSTTGKLIVNVRDTINSAMSNFEVKVFIEKSDIENDLYLLRLPTANNGQVNFGFINFGNYYITAKGVRSGQIYQGDDVVQVRAERTVEKTVIVRK